MNFKLINEAETLEDLLENIEYNKKNVYTPAYETIIQFFGIDTYDLGMSKLIMKELVEVMKVIRENKTFEYIENLDNYKKYIIYYNFLKKYLKYGISVRGSWIREKYIDLFDYIINNWDKDMVIKRA